MTDARQAVLIYDGHCTFCIREAARIARWVGGRLRLESFRAYYHLVRESQDERDLMLDAICTNETQFFREPQHFHFLTNQVLPRWRREAAAGLRSRRVRVWSAACSTGEEPYSLAMLLIDELQAREGWDVEILATDLSSQALEQTAREQVADRDRLYRGA